MKVILRNTITLALVALSTICTSCLREPKEEGFPRRGVMNRPVDKDKEPETLKSGAVVVKDTDK